MIAKFSEFLLTQGHLDNRKAVLISILPLENAILLAVEFVRLHTNPKRKRGDDLTTLLVLRASDNLNREQHSRLDQRHKTHKAGGTMPSARRLR